MVPLALFRENRQKLTDRLRTKLLGKEQAITTTPNIEDEDKKEEISNDDSTSTCRRYVVVLRGGPSPTRYDTDHEPIFRQESYFWWLTGVREPDCAMVMVIDDGDGNKIHRQYSLFVPRLPESYATIMGKIRNLDEWRDLYGVDGGVHFADTLEDFVESQLDKATIVLLLRGPNSDSGALYDELAPSFARLSQPTAPGDDAEELLKACDASATCKIDRTTLFPILADSRVVKSAFELSLMEHVTMITSFAHAYVMRNVRPGMAEYQCESLFKHYAYYNYGSRLVSYTSICGCGPNSAILHYGHTGEPNARIIEESDHCLFDMVRKYTRQTKSLPHETRPVLKSGWISASTSNHIVSKFCVCVAHACLVTLCCVSSICFDRARNISATPPM